MLLAISWTATGIAVGIVVGVITILGLAVRVFRWARERTDPRAGRLPGTSRRSDSVHAACARREAAAQTGGPHYLIENEGDTPIKDVTTGVRDRNLIIPDHTFASFRAPIIAAKSSAPVRNVGPLPTEMLSGVHESVGQHAVLYWVQFLDSKRRRWEVVYDPQTRMHEYHRLRERWY